MGVGGGGRGREGENKKNVHISWKKDFLAFFEFVSLKHNNFIPSLPSSPPLLRARNSPGKTADILQPHHWFPHEMSQRNERRNSTLMTRPYPYLGSGSDSSCQEALTCLCVERCSLSPFFLCQGEGAATRGLEGNKLLF